MIQPSDILKKALEPIPRTEWRALAQIAGVSIRALRDGAHGHTITADHLLRLCVALSVDPLTGEAIEPRPAIPFDYAGLGLFVKAQRMRKKESLRDVEAIEGIPHSSLAQIEVGRPISIMNVVKACAYVGLHPFAFMRAPEGFTCDTRSDNQSDSAAPI